MGELTILVDEEKNSIDEGKVGGGGLMNLGVEGYS